MKKKSVIAVVSALIVAAGGIAGYMIYKNSLHPAFGTYVAEDFNGNPSYISLDAEHITFTNIDFSSLEKTEARHIVMNNASQSSSSEESVDVQANKEAFEQRVEEIQKTLDFSSAFNGKTFDATDYRFEGETRCLVIYDEPSDYEVWLNITNNETIQCGKVTLSHKG